jgi:hypothetical protein
VKMDVRPQAIDVATLPYPGFPTDLLPMVIALNSVADGHSLVTENVFESRFMFVNELNQYHFLPKKMQYDFLINILRVKRRYSPWIRKDKIKDLDIVKRYYGYSNEKAQQALRILTKEQLTFIKSKFETGGTK